MPATNTEDGIRAVRGRNPIVPDSVRHYLEGKFGEDLLPPRHPGGQEGLGRQGRPGPGAGRAAGEGEAVIVAGSCTAAVPRGHFFLACLDWILPFCNFFRRLGYLVAGFLAIRLSFLAMTGTPFHRDVPLLGP